MFCLATQLVSTCSTQLTTVALQSMENVDLAGGAFLTRITACHVTTYYHVGCAYMALSRWSDATRIFINVLIFFLRMKQYHTRSYQYGSVSLSQNWLIRLPSSVNECMDCLPSPLR